MTALFLEIFVTSTLVVSENMQGTRQRKAKSTHVVHLGAYVCNHLPQPEKDIFSTFGPC